ncbi:uncharacterized protein LOC127247800 [Andrographis paniculata]|uniref:uncharacterized protein LOC127247800 n=1 Tax=Andrographis paniculata TaxID=175694 RepID=UPI0021E8F661|nr:uncharacterized protein LOC127247800 [Andrographis paniculata]
MGMERLKEIAPFVREALHHTARVAKFLCFVHVCSTYLCGVAMLTGPSMLPTFNHGNIVLTETITKRLGRVGSGDVVVVRRPDEPRNVVCKRIKAVNGDAVSYLSDAETSSERETVVVPKGHLWVEGDNTHNSRDSRQFGAVPYAMVESRVFFVVWPPKDFRLIGSKVS